MKSCLNLRLVPDPDARARGRAKAMEDGRGNIPYNIHTYNREGGLAVELE
jgi:hypothetical protein